MCCQSAFIVTRVPCTLSPSFSLLLSLSPFSPLSLSLYISRWSPPQLIHLVAVIRDLPVVAWCKHWHNPLCWCPAKLGVMSDHINAIKGRVGYTTGQHDWFAGQPGGHLDFVLSQNYKRITSVTGQQLAPFSCLSLLDLTHTKNINA